MKADPIREKLLQVMDRKNHWAWPHFAEGKVPLPRLLVHFQQEWEVYAAIFLYFLRGSWAMARRIRCEARSHRIYTRSRPGESAGPRRTLRCS